MLTDDLEAIRALIHRYAELIDLGELDALAALFTHATWSSPGRGTPRTKHVITNLVVDVDEASGTATARSYFTVVQARPDFQLQPVIAGCYHDRFVHVDDEWRFADRQIIPDLIGDLSHHLRNPADVGRS